MKNQRGIPLGFALSTKPCGVAAHKPTLKKDHTMKTYTLSISAPHGFINLDVPPMAMRQAEAYRLKLSKLMPNEQVYVINTQAE